MVRAQGRGREMLPRSSSASTERARPCARAAHNLTGLLHPTSSIPRRPKKLRPDKGGGPSALTVGGREAGSVVVSDSFHTFAPWPRSKGRREVPKNGATAKAARRGKRNCQRREKTFSCTLQESFGGYTLLPVSCSFACTRLIAFGKGERGTKQQLVQDKRAASKKRP